MNGKELYNILNLNNIFEFVFNFTFKLIILDIKRGNFFYCSMLVTKKLCEIFSYTVKSR